MRLVSSSMSVILIPFISKDTKLICISIGKLKNSGLAYIFPGPALCYSYLLSSVNPDVYNLPMTTNYYFRSEIQTPPRTVPHSRALKTRRAKQARGEVSTSHPHTHSEIPPARPVSRTTPAAQPPPTLQQLLQLQGGSNT